MSSWFIPLDAVTLWTVGVIVVIFVVAGVVCLIVGLKERQWPETRGEVIACTERPVDHITQYFPTVRILEPSGLPPRVTATRPMQKEPDIGSVWTIKYHPQGKKVWVKGETPGTMMKIGGTCFFLALLIPFVILNVIDWNA